MSLSLVTPPAVEPLTLAEMRVRLRLSDSTQDTRLTHLIRSARELVERDTGRALLSQVWRERRDVWDGDGRLMAFGTQFKLLKPPLIAVDAITTFNKAGRKQSHPMSGFLIDTLAEPGRLILKLDTVWPKPERHAAGLEIRFRCGYGDSPADVPAPLKEAVGQLIEAWWLEKPGMSKSVTELLHPYRSIRL